MIFTHSLDAVSDLKAHKGRTIRLWEAGVVRTGKKIFRAENLKKKIQTSLQNKKKYSEHNR